MNPMGPNPGMEPRGNPEMLLAHRLSERNMLDISVGGRPMHGGGMMPAPTPIVSRGGSMVHPAVIQKFLNLDPASQQKYAMMDPAGYQVIVASLQGGAVGGSSATSASSAPPLSPPPAASTTMAQSDASRGDERRRRTRARSASESSSSDSSSSDSSISASESKTKSRNKFQLPRPAGGYKTGTTCEQEPSIFSLDIRNTVREIDGNQYILSFPSLHNVQQLTLESCIIQRNSIIDKEPYVYLNIAELPGTYNVNNRGKRSTVFGKLVVDRMTDDFIIYRPEHCQVSFKSPTLIDKLTLSVSGWNGDNTSLNKLHAVKIRRLRPAGAIKVVTRGAHYLKYGDTVNMTSRDDENGTISVEQLAIQEIVDACTVIFTPPLTLNKLGGGAGAGAVTNLNFERASICCTLTFKYR